MIRNYFVKDTSSVKLGNLPRGTIIVNHEAYNPLYIDEVESIEWSKYRSAYLSYEPSCIVIVGLNRMITPQNRCDFVHEYLTTLTKNLPKIVIDTAPFIGEPWRLFFHYLFSGNNTFGADYSYVIEGEWQKWFYYEKNDCILKAENLKLYIKDTYTELERLMTDFNFYEPSDMDIDYYEDVKRIVFERNDTPKMLVNELLKHCNKHFSIIFGYDSYLSNQKLMLPNFGVYRYMVEENRRRMDIYNLFTK